MGSLRWTLMVILKQSASTNKPWSKSAAFLMEPCLLERMTNRFFGLGCLEAIFSTMSKARTVIRRNTRECLLPMIKFKLLDTEVLSCQWRLGNLRMCTSLLKRFSKQMDNKFKKYLGSPFVSIKWQIKFEVPRKHQDPFI